MTPLTAGQTAERRQTGCPCLTWPTGSVGVKKRCSSCSYNTANAGSQAWQSRPDCHDRHACLPEGHARHTRRAFPGAGMAAFVIKWVRGLSREAPCCQVLLTVRVGVSGER